jgi:hypothetical protein
MVRGATTPSIQCRNTALEVVVHDAGAGIRVTRRRRGVARRLYQNFSSHGYIRNSLPLKRWKRRGIKRPIRHAAWHAASKKSFHSRKSRDLRDLPYAPAPSSTLSLSYKTPSSSNKSAHGVSTWIGVQKTWSTCPLWCSWGPFNHPKLSFFRTMEVLQKTV